MLSLARASLAPPLAAALVLAGSACAPAGSPPILEATTSAAARAGDDDPTEVAADATTTPAVGASDPVVLVTAFVDFGCPGCKVVPALIDRLATGHRDEVQVQMRHLPIASPQSRAAAVAAAAAHRQGGAFCMARALYRSQGEWRVERSALDAAVERAADACGLDLARLERDRADPEVAAKVDHDRAVARRVGVRATPTFLVNGRRAVRHFAPGTPPSRQISARVNDEILRARAQLLPGEPRAEFVAERVYFNIADAVIETRPASDGPPPRGDQRVRLEDAEAAPSLLMN